MTQSFALGYSTCGFAAGRSMVELLEKLYALGYGGVELELDRARMHPQVHGPALFAEVRAALHRTGLRGVLGTGGRHVLTQTRHHPGAVSAAPEDRRRWVDFVISAIRLSAELGCEAVMVHSGYLPEGSSPQLGWSWLVESMQACAAEGVRCGQRIAVEWHPEMFLRTADDYLKLKAQIPTPMFGCTLDVGHAHCTEPDEVPKVIERLAGQTFHVQLEDMKDRVHKHLRLGEGALDFEGIFAAFKKTRFEGVVALEFNAGDLGGSGDELAAESIAFLRRLRSLQK